jgi:hypothetical protein
MEYTGYKYKSTVGVGYLDLLEVIQEGMINRCVGG